MATAAVELLALSHTLQATAYLQYGLVASLSLALPMTLNNLAGGVAGGVVGVSAVTAACCALAVSVGTMWFGYRLGRWYSRKEKKRNNDTTVVDGNQWSGYFSILLYSLLSLQSVLRGCCRCCLRLNNISRLAKPSVEVI